MPPTERQLSYIKFYKEGIIVNIQFLIVCLYIVFLFAISYYAQHLARGTVANYVLAGRKLTTPLIMVTIVGLAVGGASTIGVAEQAYKVGLSAGWYTTAWGIGAIVMGILLAKRYRKIDITTIPEMLNRHYNKAGMVAGIFCQILIQLVIMSLQYVAGGSILCALMPDVFSLEGGMITSAIVFIGVTSIGGMWSSALANVLNVALQYIGVIIATIICVSINGGLENIVLRVPEGVPYFDFIDGVGLMTIISWIVVLITVNLSLQSIVQISLGAKDAKTARNGFVYGGLMMLPVGFICALLGIIAKINFPDVSPALALPMTIMQLDPILAGLTLAALWAADVSTACNLLLSSATLFSQDIYARTINPHADQVKLVRITKILVVLLGLLTLGLAMTISGIIATLMIGLSLLAPFSLIVLITMFAPNLCRKSAAFNAIIAGIITLVLWKFCPATHILPQLIYQEWAVSIIVFFGTMLFDKRKIDAIEKL